MVLLIFDGRNCKTFHGRTCVFHVQKKNTFAEPDYEYSLSRRRIIDRLIKRSMVVISPIQFTSYFDQQKYFLIGSFFVKVWFESRKIVDICLKQLKKFLLDLIWAPSLKSWRHCADSSESLSHVAWWQDSNTLLRAP